MSNYTFPLLVALGGGFGCLCRYGMTIFISSAIGTGFPYGTWFVNGLGSLVIGFLSVFFAKLYPSPAAAALLITGFLGGFTTFSSFMNETLQFFLSGHYLTGLTYIGCQIISGLLCVALGYGLASRML